MQRAEPEDCIVHLRTQASIPLRVLMDTIHPILCEGSLLFTAKGMQIKGLSSIILCEATIEVPDYVCKSDQKISISFSVLHSCLSSIGQDEDVCFQLTEEGMNDVCPYLALYIINNAKDMEYGFDFKIPLLALDEEDFDIPDEDFPATVSIPSSYFNRVLRCCHKRGEYVQIVTRNQDKDNNFVIITTSGDDASVNFHLRFQVDGEWKDRSCLKLELYSLKYLLLITRATPLSSYVTLFLKHDYVLAIKYNIGTIGELMFCMSQQVDKSTTVPALIVPASGPRMNITSSCASDDEDGSVDDDAMNTTTDLSLAAHAKQGRIKRRRRKRKRRPETTTDDKQDDETSGWGDIKMSGDFIVDQNRLTPVGKREIGGPPKIPKITKTPPRQQKLTFRPLMKKKTKKEETTQPKAQKKKVARVRVARLPDNLSAAMSLNDL